MNPITPKYFDFGNGYTRFGRFSSFPTYKNGSFVSDPVFQLHKRNVAGQFVVLQQLRISSAELDKLIATKDTLKAENLILFELPEVHPKNLSMQEELNYCHGIQEISNQKNRKLFVTYKQYNIKDRESIYVQIRLFCKKDNETEFKQASYVNYKLEEFKDLIKALDIVMNDKCKVQ